MKYYCEDAAAVLKDVDSSEGGLTGEEAGKRLERDGRNELAAEKKDSLIKRFFAQMADPMIIILLVAAAISAVQSSSWVHSNVSPPLLRLGACAVSLSFGGRFGSFASFLLASSHMVCSLPVLPVLAYLTAVCKQARL